MKTTLLLLLLSLTAYAQTNTAITTVGPIPMTGEQMAGILQGVLASGVNVGPDLSVSNLTTITLTRALVKSHSLTTNTFPAIDATGHTNYYQTHTIATLFTPIFNATAKLADGTVRGPVPISTDQMSSIIPAVIGVGVNSGQTITAAMIVSAQVNVTSLGFVGFVRIQQ